ncbi:hypothetical protein KFK09_022626 [Dendrobium nobile]|uniref:Protein arginine N-methyltransferase domain-containing protein n=1 Tax=Dendrobium nobile TaxID=94219 RepID=A0A8T3AJN5_DENNO|nr:hypothetical protein KFK09_022626 [Dendrobium nobile]
MGRRKGGNKSPASISEKSGYSNGGIGADATLGGVDNEEVDVAEERTESSNLVDSSEVEALVGSDKTSADYYFDSYSHFVAFFLISFPTIFFALMVKTVLQVECSLMADMAKEIVETNGLSNVITVLKGKIEEIDLPVTHVDVIISEWMGYFLLFENMLNTVLYARDKWLVIWNKVYGFDMSCIKKQAMMEPLVDTVDQNQIVTNCLLLKTMDISKMVAGDVSFTVPFKLVAERNDYIHAFVAYFDVAFTKCHKLMGFSTGPRSKTTHWKQTVLYLEDVLTICEGEALIGSMSVEPNKKNPRDIDIMLKYSLNGRRCQVTRTQYYKMR